MKNLCVQVVDQLSSFKSVYENSVQVVHERIQSVSNKVDAIQDLIASQVTLSLPNSHYCWTAISFKI